MHIYSYSHVLAYLFPSLDTEVTYNNCSKNDDNDDDDGNVYMISLAASVILNLLLAVLVILVTCLLIRQKKRKSYSINYKYVKHGYYCARHNTLTIYMTYYIVGLRIYSL